ncbi:MAG: hypothetical protein AAGJ32_06675 [Pseudomonadota bacterium]
MLFLLNDRVLDLELPEHRLARRWRIIGCGDPTALRARDAVDFVRQVIDDVRGAGEDLTVECALDLAALIVAKTGANAAQFVPKASGPSEPRINSFAEEVLQIFRDAQDEAQSPWVTAVA